MKQSAHCVFIIVLFALWNGAASPLKAEDARGCLVRFKIVPELNNILLLFKKELAPDDEARKPEKSRKKNTPPRLQPGDQRFRYTIMGRSEETKQEWTLWQADVVVEDKQPLDEQFQVLNFIIDAEARVLIVVSTSATYINGEIIPLPTTVRDVPPPDRSTPPPIEYRKMLGEPDVAIIRGSVAANDLSVALTNIYGQTHTYLWRESKWIRNEREVIKDVSPKSTPGRKDKH